MGSPSRSLLYIRAGRAVILLVVVLAASQFLAQTAAAQIARRAKTSKGPRALGLLELAPNGQAHLIPIAIMVEGKFYDAQAYKASPVPMALWSEVVYEAERGGVSQGLFTVTGALENQKTGEWMAEGRWQTAAALAAAAHTKAAFSPKPRGMDDDQGPPVLRHSGASKPAPPESAPAQSSPAPASAPTASSTPTSPPETAKTSASSAETAAATPPTAPEPEDPNRPILKRGKQPPRPEVAESAPAANPAAGKPASSSQKSPATSQASQMQLFPAISDVGGPDPQSYVFALKAGEEEEFRKKMLALAADEIRAREKEMASQEVAAAPHPARRGKAASAKASQPNFQNVNLRVFDLANSNQATLVLTAKAEESQQASTGTTAKDYFVTLVAREDLNGDFHKVFSALTDAQRLDVEPRWELIDAVDANGDGAGELLFRKISDSGSAYAIYRVIGDRLYPLFEGTLGG